MTHSGAEMLSIGMLDRIKEIADELLLLACMLGGWLTGWLASLLPPFYLC